DPKKLLVQLGCTKASRVMKFTTASEILAKAATIRAYVREAIAAEQAGLKVETKREGVPVPSELKDAIRKSRQLKNAFAALRPGRQRRYLYHFGEAKQSVTRVSRIKKCTPKIMAGVGFLERPKR